MKFYPLQFKAIFKDRIWGGTKLNSDLHKNATSNFTGESWEISTVDDNVSVILNGIMSGKSLTNIIHKYPIEILGNSVHERFGFEFPLLFKYLDAKLDLSIQVHPNDDLARKRHSSFGKTEMWYVMQADVNAELIVGFKNDSSSQEYIKSVQNNNLLSILDCKKVHKGDVFFLEAGTVHAIGAGILIAEIQQTSDITYRIYDFDRVDTDGKKRELHNDLALKAINYNKIETQIRYSQIQNTSNVVVHCKQFKTNIIPLNGTIEISNKYDSFIVYMCVDGFFDIVCDHEKYMFKKGDTILIPAALLNFQLTGAATLLEIYI